MSESRAAFIYIVLLTLLPAIALAVSTIAAPGIEIGFFLVSIMIALAVSLYAWRYGDHIGQAVMLLIFCLLACSIILALTSLFDLANISFLGRRMDAESGMLVGGILAFCLLAVISSRQSIRFPAALAWGTLVAGLLTATYGLKYISGLQTDHAFIVTVTSIAASLAGFIALCRCKENLTDSQYLGVLSLIMLFISMTTPSTSVNLTTGLITSLIHLLAGMLFLSVRRNVPVDVRIAAVMWVYEGFTSFAQETLLEVFSFNDIAAGIPTLICSILVIAWSRFHKDELSRGLYWVSWIIFSYQGIYSILPQGFSDPLNYATVGTILLFAMVCMWFAPSPLPSLQSTWRVRIRYACATCGFIIAMTVTGAWFKVSIDMLAEDSSPVLLISKLKGTPLWPGDRTFVRLAMLNESLWPGDIRNDPSDDVKLDDYIDVIRPAGDRFSHISNTVDYRNADNGFYESLGINWKRKKDHVAILQVNRRSSAGLAGLTRGERVLAINNVQVRDLGKLDDSGWDRLFGGWKPGAAIALDVMAVSGTKRKVTVTVGYDIQDPPMSRIITTARGKKVGYLYLDSFNTAQFEDIRKHFSEFKKNGVNDLVLDLRYNGGGHLVNAWRLGNLIAGERYDGRQFLHLEHSPRYVDLDAEYSITKLPESMHTVRMVVLTTKDTCSASEAVINGLRPYLPVSTVGSATCGKPYSMSPIEFGDDTLMPVAARVLNARGEGHYTKGMRPDCKVGDDTSHLLGDPEEGMLKAALTVLDTGVCPETR